MADRSAALTVIKGGINRLRTKGAALNDSLYDALNCYVTAAKTVRVRPGTFRHADLSLLDATLENPTKGLASFDGALHVFATQTFDVPDGFVLHVLQHPVKFNSDGSIIPLRKIHFATPFMGFLYVVAEFEDADTLNELGNTFHFWLQTGDVWEANKVYKLGDIVSPSTPNGFSYQANRISAPNLSWAPNRQRQIGDVIEPTAYNDFYYTVVDTQGSNPRSGTAEPIWPLEDGAQIFEDADGGEDTTSSPTPTLDPTTAPDPTTQTRYNRGILVGGTF